MDFCGDDDVVKDALRCGLGQRKHVTSVCTTAWQDIGYNVAAANMQNPNFSGFVPYLRDGMARVSTPSASITSLTN